MAIWLLSAHNARQAAAALFAEADDPVAWREVIAKYPDSRTGRGLRICCLAGSLREQGKLEESSGASTGSFWPPFQRARYLAGHGWESRKIWRSQGKTDEALAALRQVQETESGSYAAPFAALLEGRMLVREASSKRPVRSSPISFPLIRGRRRPGRLERNWMRLSPFLPTPSRRTIRLGGQRMFPI